MIVSELLKQLQKCNLDDIIEIHTGYEENHPLDFTIEVISGIVILHLGAFEPCPKHSLRKELLYLAE